MSERVAYDVFDVPRFVADVDAARQRWGLTRGELLARADLADSGVGYAILRGDRAPGIVAIVLLANACDLSLDTYRLAGVRR